MYRGLDHHGQYAGLCATLLQFVAHATSYGNAGFWVCSILMRDVKDGRLTDLVPACFVSLAPPGA